MRSAIVWNIAARLVFMVTVAAIGVLAGGCPVDDPPVTDVDAGYQVDARELDARPDITGRACDRANPCSYGWCCHASAQQCVRGIHQGPGQDGAGGDFLDICYADTSAVPMPEFACAADGFEGAPCDGPEDCHLPGYPDGSAGDGLCCATSIGKCVRGIDRDTQGFAYPSCYARTDFAVDPALCEGGV